MNNSTGQSVRFRPNLNQQRRNGTPGNNQQNGLPSNSQQSANTYNGVQISSHQNGVHANIHQNGHQNPQQSRRGNRQPNRPYFSDPLLLVRVSEYIRSLGRNAFVNIDIMLVEFQREYPEYRRRQRSAFKNHLVKAVDVVKFENSLVEVEEEDSESEIDVIYGNLDNENISGNQSRSYALEGDGDVNSTLEDSYLQQNARNRRTSERTPQELICVSSSDEDETSKSDNVDPGQSDTVKLKQESEDERKNVSKKRKGDTLANSRKRFKSSIKPLQPKVTFKDIGGNGKVLREVTKLLVHLLHPEVYRTLGVSPPRGFLLHGPPGSGKTLLANAIAGELKLPLLKVAAPELVGGLSGQSEERIRELFEQAVALAPCIVFIDEVDAITPNRETAQREMERRIVAQLLASMDDLATSEEGARVLVIGATNRPDSLDPALRRAGRFDREVCLGIPDHESRKSILHTLCNTLRLNSDLNLDDVASLTPGFVGADLKGLVTDAAMASVRRLFKHLSEKEKIGSNTKEESEKENPDSKTKEEQKTQEKEVSMQVNDDHLITEEKKDDGNKSEPGSTVQDSKEKAEQKQEPKISVTENKKKEDKDTKEDKETKVSETPDPPENVQAMEVEVSSISVEKSTEDEEYFLEQCLLHSAPLTPEQLKDVYITMDDFKIALKSVQPSAKREGFATVPDVRWEDIGSLQDIRRELQMAILAPVRYPRQYARLGLQTPTGILLCGPPGCGKTLLAKAIANEAGINFISVKGPELLNMYVGESERAVRQCFQRARSSQPCVIFFDEIDALCPKRSGMENGASRVVNQLLTEMDGVEGRTGVFLMAATNRPDIVDPAVMRPGRLDKVLYVGMPNANDKADILRAITKDGTKPRIAAEVNFRQLAEDPRCARYTGADLGALVRQACMEAIKEYMDNQSDPNSMFNLEACLRHFSTALDTIRPSVSDVDKARYEILRLQYAAVPTV